MKAGHLGTFLLIFLVAMVAVAAGGFGLWVAVDAQRGGGENGGREGTVADIAAWMNPPNVDRYPAIVARLTSGGFSTDVTAGSVAALIESAKVKGEPVSEREARDEAIAGAVMRLAVEKRGLLPSEQEAADVYREQTACLDGRTTAPNGALCAPLSPEDVEIRDYIEANSTEAEQIEGYRRGMGLGRLRSEILKDLTPEERLNRAARDARYNAFVEQEKKSITIIEVVGEKGDRECTEDGQAAPCPADILAELQEADDQ